jgi:hypothetical protein
MVMSHKSNSRQRIPDPVAAWDALLDAAAEDDLDSYEPTPDDRQWARSVDAMVQDRLDALQRQLGRGRPAIQRGVAIPPEIAKLDRPALVAQLEALRRSSAVRYAHQDLKGLSDHDLRTMLAVALRNRGR